MRTETQSSQLGLRQRNGGGEVFDFGAMVEAFGRIRSRLIEIAGHQKGRDEYYRVLGAFRSGHANRFKSAAEARRAYRVPAATAAQWEAEPPTAAEDVGPAQLGFWCGATEGRPQAEAEEYRCKSSGNEQCSRPRTIAGRMSHTSRRQDRRLRRQIRLKRNIRFPGRGLRRHTQAPNPHPGAKSKCQARCRFDSPSRPHNSADRVSRGRVGVRSVHRRGDNGRGVATVWLPVFGRGVGRRVLRDRGQADESGRVGV